MAVARPDFKRGKRIKDADVYRLFHGTDRHCLCCGSAKVQAHHVIERSHGGDDVDANLVPLCAACHGALHSGWTWIRTDGQHVTKHMVDLAIAEHIRGDNGEATARYLISKLGGMIEAEAFVLRLEGKA